jgi:tetratricopeptide (TPR) repeat protein
MEAALAPGKAVLAASLPGSGRVLVWVPSWRQADAGDPEKGMDSRLFVYDPRKKSIDTAMTRKLAGALGKAVDECQGLGTVAELRQSGKGVTLHQFYAPGTMHLNCSSTVSWRGGKFGVEMHPSGDSSLGAVAREQEQAASDDQALALWRSGKRDLALAMWEQLYARGDYQSPSFADVCNNLGFAYGALREFKKAEEVLLDCEKSFPGRATIQLNLGDVYRDTGRAKEARERYQHFLEMEGGTPEQRRAAEKNLERLKGRP